MTGGAREQRAPGHRPCVLAVWSLESQVTALAIVLPWQVITSHSAAPASFSETVTSPLKAFNTNNYIV